MLECGPYRLNWKEKTLIMGILNITPDSFSDGGRHHAPEAAVAGAMQMKKDGADILDIGGESTRPGHEPVTDAEEMKRVLPAIKAISQEVSLPISIDTYKASTAQAAIEAGAHIINDIWGARKDPEIASVAAEQRVPIILMHNRDNRNYTCFIDDVLRDLDESITIAKRAGVEDQNIVLDPGIGFAKDFHENMMMMRNLHRLVDLGYPVLLGTSRKRMIGHVLDLPVDERMEGTGATVCFGIEQGCQIMRVHDVKEIGRMARMMDALLGKGD